MDKRKSWFTLASGRRFYPFDPRPEDIRIEDIALALSHLCRYNGHCKKFYSVAEHSVHCSHYVASGHEFTALMHDATEAYVGDLIRPIKRFTPNFQEAEDLVWAALCERFDLPREMPEEVHYVDNLVLVTNGAKLMEEWGIPIKPVDDLVICQGEVEPMHPEEAEKAFLARFHELREAA